MPTDLNSGLYATFNSLMKVLLMWMVFQYIRLLPARRAYDVLFRFIEMNARLLHVVTSVNNLTLGLMCGQNSNK
jgi:hypothetical protein